MLHPVWLDIFGVLDLVHDRQRVSAVGIDAVVEAYRGAHRIQRLADLFSGQLQGLGDFLQRGLPAERSRQGFLALQDLVGNIPNGPGDPDHAVVPEIAPHLTGDHRYPVRTEAHAFLGVKIGNGLYKADAAHLEQVVRAFSTFVEALDDGEYQPQIALNERLPGLLISLAGSAQERIRFLLTQNAQLGGADTADIYLSLHE